ncbi:MAG TPA: ATP-binding protein [Gemmatimonadaceae bacterium]|nr:ATP-binding protein [Gemmatimonadaceae bacterium]
MTLLPPAAGPAAPPEAMRLRLELEIPSDVRYIEPIVGVVQRECELFGFPPRHCALNVPVALSEALSNAILRGNEESPEKLVRVRARVDAGTIVLEVADEGAGFDLEESTVDATDPVNLEREDGRGIFLMRALMDRVERYQEDGTNVVRLTLRRP